VSDDDFDVPDETFDEVADEFPDDDTADHQLPDDDLPDDAAPVADQGIAGRWEAPEPTGVQAVDDALTPLRELDDLPTAEHVPYYEAVHRQLQDALADLDGA
jgi:hypothetical protein